MYFLEKHYPDVALSRGLLENRLRQLENRLQQKDKKIHLTHHIEMENNITHLYDLLRKTAQKQTLMQTQINLLRNKSIGMISHEQFEHKQKLNELKYAYKLAEDQAYSLKKRIQCYYPHSIIYNQYKSPLEKLDIDNRILQQKVKLQQQAQRNMFAKIKNSYLQQQEQLRQLSRERESINNLLTKQYSSQNYHSPKKHSFQVPLNRSNTYSNLQTAQFDKINKDLHKINSELNSIYNSHKINEPIHQVFQYQTDRKKRTNQNIGKLYSRKGQYQNDEFYKQQESKLKNESIINKFNLSAEQKNDLTKTQVKNNDQEQNSNQYESKQQMQTRANKNDVSHSISYSNFKPKFDEVLDQQSQEEYNQITQQTPNKTLKNKKIYNQIKHKRANSYSNTMKRSISAKKKRENANTNTIYKNILLRIKNRADNAWALYQDATFRNVKYQHEHLFNTFKLQSRLRKDICSKIFKHHLAERKFGVI